MSIVREPSIPRVGGPCWGDMDDDASLPELMSQSSPSAKTTTLPSILSEEITPDNPHTTKHMLNSSPPARLQLDFRAIVSSWTAHVQPSACLSPSVITSTSTPTSIPSTSTSVSSISRTESMSPKDPICKALNFEPQPLPTIQEFDAELDSSRDGLPLLFKSTGLSTTTAQATPTLTRTTTPVSVWGNLPISAPRVPLSSIQQQQAAITPPPSTAPATRKRRHTPLKAVVTPSKQVLKMSTDKKQDTVMSSSSSSHPAGWTPDRSKQLIHAISGSPRADSVDVQTPINGKKQRRSTPTSISPITVPLTPTQDIISLPSTPHTCMSTSTSPSALVATSPLSITSSPAPTTDIDPLTLTPSTPATATKGQRPRTLTRTERLAQRQKQIDLGKKTQGYQHYIQTIPKRERTSAHPKTPNIHKVCSKRSWDGQVRQWRRLLHTFDPHPQSNTNGEQDQDELNTSGEHDALNTSIESDGVEVNIDEKENDGDVANRGDAENEEEWTLVEKGEDAQM